MNTSGATSAAVNLRFPYGFDAHGRTANPSLSDHVRQMIELLLLTNPGERVNRPDFGGGLLQTVFAPNSPEGAAALELTLSVALARWLGDVIEVNRLIVASDEGRLLVELDYVVTATGDRQVELVDAGVPA
jgi:uncharacterized protein